jgi:Kelch motif
MSCSASAGYGSSIAELPDGTNAQAQACSSAVRVLLQWPSDKVQQAVPVPADCATRAAVLAHTLSLFQQVHETSARPDGQASHQGADEAPHPAVPCNTAGAVVPDTAAQRRRPAAQLFAMGGRDQGWRAVRSAAVYDPAADTWVPAPPLPCTSSYACATGMEGTAYVLCNGSSMHTLDSAQPLEKWWWRDSSQDAEPVNQLEPALFPAVTAAGGHIWAISGRTIQNEVCLLAVSGKHSCMPGSHAERLVTTFRHYWASTSIREAHVEHNVAHSAHTNGCCRAGL